MSPSGSRVARSALSTVLLSTVLALGLGGAPSVSAPAPDGPASDGPGTAAPDLLPRPMSGKRAVRTLGSDLAAAARVNGRTPDELQALLEHDPAATLDQGGRLHFRDDLSARSLPAARAASPSFPLSETFQLHSRPGSNRVIYLDFDGGTVSGTEWNKGYGVSTSSLLGFSLDGDYSSFSSQERAHIQEIWQRVAEDYAPFDVDVTTQEPAPSDITRHGTSDLKFGTRALITDDRNPLDRICGGNCTGVAYLDVFDEPDWHGDFQPAFAFTAEFNDVFNVAETISHEVGHNFGLVHDGDSSVNGDNYYRGHGNWAPIMGSGTGPVIQWSDGGYSGATNYTTDSQGNSVRIPLQDDVAIINSNGAPYRSDDASNTIGSAGPVPVAGTLGTGIIETRADVDVFALGQCNGPVEITASPAPVSPNLDIKLDVLNASNQVLDSDDPHSDKSDRFTATGLGAQVNVADATGLTLFARVDGVGNGTPDNDYDDYGSIGRYTLDVVCGADVPGKVSGLAASSSAPTTATATWSTPADDGGSSITGYRVSLVGGGSTEIPAGTTSHTFTGLSPDTTYTVQVAAVNGEGDGPTSSTTVTTQAEEVVEPTDPLAGPKIKKGFYNRKGTKLTLKWRPVDGAAGYVVVFTNRRGNITKFFDRETSLKTRISMRKVPKKSKFVQMVAYDLEGEIGDYGKRWRL